MSKGNVSLSTSSKGPRKIMSESVTKGSWLWQLIQRALEMKGTNGALESVEVTRSAECIHVSVSVLRQGSLKSVAYSATIDMAKKFQDSSSTARALLGEI